MTVLDLQKAIIYGPISSRRLGCSLGVNILPFDYKLCSLNCLYCQYGWTKECTLRAVAHASDLPRAGDVAASLRQSLEELKEAGVFPSYITFSGNGEPTLHPELEDIVRVVKSVRDEVATDALVAILSNSTTVMSETVRRTLEQFDVRIMKVDCGDVDTFVSYNRPCPGVELEEICEALKMLSSFSVQALLTNRNSSESSIEKWIDVIGDLGASDVQIYTLDRPTSSPELNSLSKDRLEQIARRVTAVTGMRAVVY